MSDAAYVAFDGDRRIASGELRDVARAAKQMLDRRKDAAILVFDGRSSAPVDIDFRGSVDDVLPRHWDWLSKQKGGASVAIRRLIEDARRTGEDRDRVRLAQDSAYRFMSAMAGNRPH